MNFNERINKFLWIIPAIIIFFIALIPTLKYQWPLSWDVIMHVEYAKVYAQYGFVLIDPHLNAPYGQKIGYPPLFHFLLAGLGTLLKIDFFQVARFLQPVLAMSIVLSVSYVAKEFYGRIAGISAGFLIISSYLITRIVLPIPENLALIFLPLAVYLYYRSVKEGVLKYALIAGLMLILIISIHLAAPLCLFLIITAFTVLELILSKKIGILKNYGAFLISLIILAIVGLITLSLFRPDMFHSLIQQGLTAVTGYSTSLGYNKAISALSYLGNIGPLVLIFAVIGCIFAFKKIQKKHFFILVWILAMFLLSNAYWFDINVISYRVLIYLLIPLTIIGGFGLSQLYYWFKQYNIFSSRSFRSAFLIGIFALSAISGILTVENPKIAKFGTVTKYGYIQTAPPSDSEADMANWFNKNGNKTRSVVISNLYTGTFLAAESGMPIVQNFKYFNKSTPLSIFKKEKIGYIVYDKRLTFPFKNENSYTQTNSEMYSLLYFDKSIKINISEIIPGNVKVVYENEDFIVCKVQY